VLGRKTFSSAKYSFVMTWCQVDLQLAPCVIELVKVDRLPVHHWTYFYRFSQLRNL